MTTQQFTNRVNIINNQDLEKRLFIILASTVAFSIALYIYFIASITFNIVARKGLEANAHALSSTVADLEGQYLALSNGITLDKAQTLGFIEPKTMSFAPKTSSAAMLETNDNEL